MCIRYRIKEVSSRGRLFHRLRVQAPSIVYAGLPSSIANLSDDIRQGKKKKKEEQFLIPNIADEKKCAEAITIR